MLFFVKDFENLEGKEKWEDIFLHRIAHMRSAVGVVAESIEGAKGDPTFWKGLDFKRVDGVFMLEIRFDGLEQLILEIGSGIKAVMKMKDKTGFDEFAVDTMEGLLRVAKTCARLKRPLVMVL